MSSTVCDWVWKKRFRGLGFGRLDGAGALLVSDLQGLSISRKSCEESMRSCVDMKLRSSNTWGLARGGGKIGLGSDLQRFGGGTPLVLLLLLIDADPTRGFEGVDVFVVIFSILT